MHLPRSGLIRILSFAVLLGLAAGCGFSPYEILPDVPTPTTNVAGADSDAAQLESGSTVPADDCLVLDEPADETHKAVFEALNDFRVANGLEPLVYSVRLEMAADAHVKDLYDRGFFAHINPDGDNPGKRAVRFGFCHEYVGENIAAGQKTVEAAQRAWENSPSHRQNMLQPDYRYAGIGVYRDPSGRMYWAQEMAFHLP